MRHSRPRSLASGNVAGASTSKQGLTSGETFSEASWSGRMATAMAVYCVSVTVIIGTAEFPWGLSLERGDKLQA